MANTGHVIAVASDTRLFEQGVRMGIIKPLAAADDKLDDLGKNKGLDQLDGDLTKAQHSSGQLSDETRRAVAAFNKSERAAKDYGRTIDRTTREGSRDVKRLGDDIEDESRKGFGKAGDYTKEFSDEAFQNFSEVTSSFDGSMSSIVDLTQGTFGGLASLGGPIGLAMGGIAALFGGLASSWVQGLDEAAQKNEQRVSDMYQDMIDSGNNYLSQEAIAKGVQAIQEDTAAYAQVQKDAYEAGIDLDLLLRAQAGDAKALAQVQSMLSDEIDKTTDASRVAAGGSAFLAQGYEEHLDSLKRMASEYDNVANGTDTAAAKARVFTQTMAESAAAADKTGKSADGVSAALKRIPDSTVVKVIPEVGDIDAMRRRLEAPLKMQLQVYTDSNGSRRIL